jgi:hypothetical protein
MKGVDEHQSTRVKNIGANSAYKLWLGLCPFGKYIDFPKLVYIWRGLC